MTLAEILLDNQTEEEAEQTKKALEALLKNISKD